MLKGGILHAIIGLFFPGLKDKNIGQIFIESTFKIYLDYCKNKIDKEEIKILYEKLKEKKFIVKKNNNPSNVYDIINPDESLKPIFEKYIRNYTYGKDNKKLDEEQIEHLMNWWDDYHNHGKDMYISKKSSPNKPHSLKNVSKKTKGGKTKKNTPPQKTKR